MVGIVSFNQFEREVKFLLHDSSASLVTTMIDFYGLAGKGFPGWDDRPKETCYRQVEYVETALARYVDHPRFLPYLALHEFEAMLFVDLAAILHEFPENPREQLQQLAEVKAQFDSPEEINHEHPPSKRLREIVGTYNKSFGALITVTIGLSAIRAVCPHFDAWLQKIEALADA